MNGDRPFSDAEMIDLLAQARNPRDFALIEMEHWTGLRISEVLLLTFGDVARNWHTINDLILAWQPKVQQPRQVVVNGDLKAALRRYFGWLGGRRVAFTKSRPLFFSPRFPRRAITSRQARRIVQGAAHRAGLVGRIGTHSLRKTSAELVYDRSHFDIKAVQAFLGHKSVASTGCYVGFQAERKARAIILAAGPGPAQDEAERMLFEG